MLTLEEIAEFEEADRIFTAEQALADASGLTPIHGCICYGGNTPWLIGRCPCQGVDLRAGTPAPAGWDDLTNVR